MAFKVNRNSTSSETAPKKVEKVSFISADADAVAGDRLVVDTSAAITITLPLAPEIGDEVQIFDGSNAAETNSITVNNNSKKINGTVDTLLLDVNAAAVSLIYTGSEYGWRIG